MRDYSVLRYVEILRHRTLGTVSDAGDLNITAS